MSCVCVNTLPTHRPIICLVRLKSANIHCCLAHACCIKLFLIRLIDLVSVTDNISPARCRQKAFVHCDYLTNNAAVSLCFSSVGSHRHLVGHFRKDKHGNWCKTFKLLFSYLLPSCLYLHLSHPSHSFPPLLPPPFLPAGTELQSVPLLARSPSTNRKYPPLPVDKLEEEMNRRMADDNKLFREEFNVCHSQTHTLW